MQDGNNECKQPFSKQTSVNISLLKSADVGCISITTCTLLGIFELSVNCHAQFIADKEDKPHPETAFLHPAAVTIKKYLLLSSHFHMMSS
jgi:hypothetical protein